MTYNISDPLENIVAAALERSGTRFIHETEDNKRTMGLDFYLPDIDVHIEVKQFHSDRISKQMSRADNVIALQGHFAVAAFCTMLCGEINILDLVEYSTQ